MFMIEPAVVVQKIVISKLLCQAVVKYDVNHATQTVEE
jgi:hypothetical protein